MGAIVVEFVDFDDDETCYEEVDADIDQQGVSDGSLTLLCCGMCRL